MARETNFIDLYRLLNVQPGCDIAEFKAAYRRRVAVLHPDRRGLEPEDLIASERLQQLSMLYSAAMDFSRRHGRLPGALFTPLPDDGVTKPAVGESTAEAKERRTPWLLVALALILGIVWLVWNPDWFSNADDPDSSAEVASSATTDTEANKPAPTSRTSIDIGMDTGAVRRIEGEPMILGDSQWEYGPSWIRFENGNVVDWYSSPLHPLKTSSSHARTDDN